MHVLENIMQTTMSEIKEMIDVNTVVGDAVITPDGNTIIPISKVCFGFLSGGGEYGETVNKGENTAYPFAGGSSAGISISPMAFLVVGGDNVKMLSVNHKSIYENLVEAAPILIKEIKNAFKCDEEPAE